MKGELVPLVLIPRFTTYVGATTFTSNPLDLGSFETGLVTLWRGPVLGTSSPTFKAFIETSEDKNAWTSQNGATGYTPNTDEPFLVTLDLSRRYVRISVVLTGTNPVATCWCAGSLELRRAS